MGDVLLVLVGAVVVASAITAAIGYRGPLVETERPRSDAATLTERSLELMALMVVGLVVAAFLGPAGLLVGGGLVVWSLVATWRRRNR